MDLRKSADIVKRPGIMVSPGFAIIREPIQILVNGYGRPPKIGIALEIGDFFWGGVQRKS